MADALCGPSNALQNFQKHSSVDRTLQQDRLTTRHSPSQGFRSPPGSNAGALDPEFDAFQAGHAGPPQPDFHHLPPHLAHAPPPPPQFAQAPQALPDWATDFQRLNISPQPLPIQQHRPPVSNAGPAWHQEFMGQQSSIPQAANHQQNMLRGMPGYGINGFQGSAFQQSQGFGSMNGIPTSEVAQGKQRAQEAITQFDEAAFEQAFAQAQQDMLEEAEAQAQAEPVSAIQERHELPVETDPILQRIQQKRPAVYAALKLRSELDLGKSADVIPFVANLEDLEQSGQLTADVSEAKWVVDALQKIVNHNAPVEVQARAEALIKATNERLMSTYPLLASRIPINHENIWKEVEAAGYTRTPVPERVEQQQQSEQKQEEQHPQHDDDEMAQTAGRLLERVADNTSEKFQNSQFLELMRRLRDREVRVEGDKMVEVSAEPSTSSSSPPTKGNSIPEVDPRILDHAATDFDMPMDSEQETIQLV